MEIDWVCKRAHLRALLDQHPGWSRQQLADAVGCSKSMVNKWKNRFAEADPHSAVVLFSRSRAPHHHRARLSEEVVERIIEMRLAPPEHLRRTPGPKALLYYLDRDEPLRLRGLRLPRSTRTIWQILDQTGLIERDEERKRAPLPQKEPLQEVQVDFKEVSTAAPDPTSPLSKQHHLLETCNAGGCGLFSPPFRTSARGFSCVIPHLMPLFSSYARMACLRPSRWIEMCAGLGARPSVISLRPCFNSCIALGCNQTSYLHITLN